VVVVFWALWVLGGSVVCLFAPSLFRWLAALLLWFVDLLSLNQTRICFFFFCCFFLVLEPLSVPTHLAVFSLHRDRETELLDLLLCENKRRRPCFFLKSSRTHALRERRVHHDDCLSEMTRNDPYSCCSGRFKPARVCVVSCCSSSHQCYGALKL